MLRTFQRICYRDLRFQVLKRVRETIVGFCFGETAEITLGYRGWKLPYTGDRAAVLRRWFNICAKTQANLLDAPWSIIMDSPRGSCSCSLPDIR